MRISDWSSDVCSSDLKPTETVGDPACGTGGFLVGVARYLWETYTSPEGIHVDAETGQKIYTGDRLEPHLDHIRKSLFHGFDFDTTMLRIAAMNLLLHGIDAPDIQYQDPLATSFTARFPKRARDAFDVILANPPFKGSLDEEDVHRSEEHTSELQSLMRISSAVFCLKKKNNKNKI